MDFWIDKSDAAGQLLSEGGLWADDTVSYTYNNRLRTGLSLQTPNASAWTQSYGYVKGSVPHNDGFLD